MQFLKTLYKVTQMKKVLPLLLFVFSIHCNISSQWLWKNPTPEGHPFDAITFSDSLTGWAAGPFGIIIKTIDGGKSWKQQLCPSNKWLTSASFIDSKRGWISGHQGTLLKTTNGGENWTQLLTAPGDLDYTSVCFADSNSGYLISEHGKILRTSDGGKTWSEKFNDQEFMTYHVTTKNPDIAWAVGFKLPDMEHPLWQGAVLNTTDAGSTWKFNRIDSTNYFNSVFFINKNIGWAAGTSKMGGKGEIIKTEDGGISWKRLNVNASVELKSVFFLDENKGWACGDRGTVLKTTDGGKSWEELSANSNAMCKDIIFVNENRGFLSGTGLSASSDGGKTWTDLWKSVNNKSVLSINFPTNKTGWMVGDYGLIMKTTDQGEHWNVQYNGLTPYTFLMSAFFVDTLTGYAVGSMETYLLKTTDGGLNWVKKPFGFSAYTYSTYFLNADTGWVVGYGGCIMTTDGGDSWIRRSNDERTALFSLKFFNKDLGYAVSNEAVGKTTDGGCHWTVLGLDYDFAYKAVFFIDENTGLAAGNGIKKTTDGGATWKMKYSVENVSLEAIYFRDKSIGWAVGSHGQIIKTTDGGETWQQDYSDCTKLLYSVFVTHDGTVWAAGEEGTILQNKTMTGAEGSISEVANEPSHLLLKYSLDQNYPNPFNPSTVIEFTTENYGHVTIKVFDLLGREVADIFDKEISAGRHKITFNASALPSGTYIYRLEAGGAITARKMILVK